MVLDHEPPTAPSGVEVRAVKTLDDFRLMLEIDLEGFAAPEKDREELGARLAEDWAQFRALRSSDRISRLGRRRTHRLRHPRPP